MSFKINIIISKFILFLMHKWRCPGCFASFRFVFVKKVILSLRFFYRTYWSTIINQFMLLKCYKNEQLVFGCQLLKIPLPLLLLGIPSHCLTVWDYISTLVHEILDLKFLIWYSWNCQRHHYHHSHRQQQQMWYNKT